MTTFVVGVDISKVRLDVYLQQTGRHRQFPNTAEGCRRLTAAVAKAADGQEVVIRLRGHQHL